MKSLSLKSGSACLIACVLIAGAAGFAPAQEPRNPVGVQDSNDATAMGPTVRVLRIDGTAVEGAWLRVVEGRQLVLKAAEETTTLPLDELQRVIFPSEEELSPRERIHQEKPDAVEKGVRVVLDLADGGQMEGRLIDGEGETVVVDCVLGAGVSAKLDRLAGVQFSSDPTYQAAHRAYLDALSKRRSAEDVLITLDDEDPRVLPGRIERLGGDSEASGIVIEFMFGGRSRTVRVDRLFGIVLAGGVGERSVFPATFELRDGTVVSGRITESDGESLTASTSLDTVATIRLDQLRSIRLRSDRVVYVSDLPISSERTEGLLHRPWPVRKDRNVMGGPLSIGGRSFEKGIGCHSLTELRFKIGGQFESFAATIGIDDHVRPRGAVEFRVLGDGDVIWESGPVTGRDEPRDVVVDVSGVSELTLLVDYGEGLDLSDHATWGGARLIRPAKSPSGVQ